MESNHTASAILSIHQTQCRNPNLCWIKCMCQSNENNFKIEIPTIADMIHKQFKWKFTQNVRKVNAKIESTNYVNFLISALKMSMKCARRFVIFYKKK